MQHKSCNNIAKSLKIAMKKLRRLKLDIIMMYKILHGLVTVDTLFNVRLDDTTRGDFEVLKPHCNVNSRAHSFACRRLNCWYSLPNDVRNASSVFVFKRLLSKCDFANELCVLLSNRQGYR